MVKFKKRDLYLIYSKKANVVKRKEKPLDGEEVSVIVERELNKKEFGECSIDYCNQIR